VHPVLRILQHGGHRKLYSWRRRRLHLQLQPRLDRHKLRRLRDALHGTEMRRVRLTLDRRRCDKCRLGWTGDNCDSACLATPAHTVTRARQDSPGSQPLPQCRRASAPPRATSRQGSANRAQMVPAYPSTAKHAASGRSDGSAGPFLVPDTAVDNRILTSIFPLPPRPGCPAPSVFNPVTAKCGGLWERAGC
jgi:hypothetical protein